MRVVVDANVLVSALINPAGAPASLLRRARSREFELVTSATILVELRRALDYPRVRRYLRGTERDVEEWVIAVEGAALVVLEAAGSASVASDPDDTKYLAVAAEAGASFVVTGDRHLLEVREWQGVRIVRPRQFLDHLDSSR